MSNEAKCNCQYCNGHITFPSEMAGQSINCPHCQLETLLFIPPAAVLPKQPTPGIKHTTALRLLVVAAAVVACAAAVLFFQNWRKETKLPSERSLPKQADQTIVESAKSSPERMNLKAVVGAFGWKLGDKLPEQLKSKAHDGTYSYERPEEEMPPFHRFEIRVADDGRIYYIEARGVVLDYEQAADKCKNALVSLLSEKYGLRDHDPIDFGRQTEYYVFGSGEQSVRLEVVSRELLRVIYYDEQFLKPAVGGFGWKLGDELPEQLKSKAHDGSYSYERPEEEMPPFHLFDIWVADDGRIYKIRGTGFVHGQAADEYKKATVSLLSEQYGLRHHSPNDLGGDNDLYEFGSAAQSVSLEVFNTNLFHLGYHDEHLGTVAYEEREARRRKDEDRQKAAPPKGL